MSRNIEPPPAFVSETKSYAEYKNDLEMWSRITGLDKKLQAETVVYRLEGELSRIKEKIVTQIGDKLKDNENGIAALLEFLDTIYKTDDMADAWDRFVEFSSVSRKSEQSMVEFISEWKNIYHKAKKVGCEYSDIILAFKLLQDSNLQEMEVKLVLTGVNYTEGKEKKNLMDQVIESLKKFKGRSAVSGGNNSSSSSSIQVEVKSEPTWLNEAQHVLISKG